MRASDVVQPPPAARLVGAVPPATRTVVRRDLPRYTGDEPCLARTFGEAHAGRVADGLLGATVRDVAGEVRIPLVRAAATLVELAETKSRERCALVMVEQRETGVVGVGTAGRELEVLAGTAVGETPR